MTLHRVTTAAAPAADFSVLWIGMIQGLSCCRRARSPSTPLRARVRRVISERRVVHDQVGGSARQRPAAHRRPAGTIRRRSSASNYCYTSRGSAPQRLPCCVDMIRQQQVVRARHGRATITMVCKNVPHISSTSCCNVLFSPFSRK